MFYIFNFLQTPCPSLDFSLSVDLPGHFNRNICIPVYSSCGSGSMYKIMPFQVKSSFSTPIKHGEWRNSVISVTVFFFPSDRRSHISDSLEGANIQYLMLKIKESLYLITHCFWFDPISVVLCSAAARAGQPRWATVISGPSRPPEQQQWRSAVPVWEQLTSLSHLYQRHCQESSRTLTTSSVLCNLETLVLPLPLLV